MLTLAHTYKNGIRIGSIERSLCGPMLKQKKNDHYYG